MPTDSSAIAVILAAGEGRRMGLPKALLEYTAEETFLGHLASVFRAAGCRVLAVTGHDAERVRRRHHGLEMLENLRWPDGQFSSAQFGIREALSRDAIGVLVHPVDAPTIRAETVRLLLKALPGSEPVVPEYQGALGHPLGLPRAAAEVVSRATGPHLEAVLQRLSCKRLAVEDPGVCLNINTPAEYERALGHPPRLSLGAPDRA